MAARNASDIKRDTFSATPELNITLAMPESTIGSATCGTLIAP